jgi:hypothetical protein
MTNFAITYKGIVLLTVNVLFAGRCDRGTGQLIEPDNFHEAKDPVRVLSCERQCFLLKLLIVLLK